MKYKKRIAPLAHRDIEGIRNYIANDKPKAAIKVVNKIYSSFDLLQDNPKIGTSIRKKFEMDTDFLFLVVAPYIVFYKVEKEYVSIYRVLDGRSNYLTVLGLHQH